MRMGLLSSKWYGNGVAIKVAWDGVIIKMVWEWGCLESGPGMGLQHAITYHNTVTAFLPKLHPVMAATDIGDQHTRGGGIHPTLPWKGGGGGGEVYNHWTGLVD